jgi:hypothetical protein
MNVFLHDLNTHNVGVFCNNKQHVSQDRVFSVSMWSREQLAHNDLS